MLRRIISGGQTGADRGGLDAAIMLGIKHGGSCPAGRRAEDGGIPLRYRMSVLPIEDYPARPFSGPGRLALFKLDTLASAWQGWHAA